MGKQFLRQKHRKTDSFKYFWEEKKLGCSEMTTVLKRQYWKHLNIAWVSLGFKRQACFENDFCFNP